MTGAPAANGYAPFLTGVLVAALCRMGVEIRKTEGHHQ